MIVQEIPISDINPAPYNPRKDLQPDDPEYQAIKRSLDHFGLVDPLVWNKRNGVLVGGHQRLKVLINDHKKESVHVSVVDLDDENERALNLSLNRNAGVWDYEALKLVFEQIDPALYPITGFEAFEIQNLKNGEFVKPEITDGENGSGGQFSFSCTKDQAEIVKQAIKKVREDASEDFSDGRCLELICADYLGKR